MWGSELAVAAALRPWIRDVRLATADTGQHVLTHLPEPSTVLVFRTLADQHSDLLVVGPRTRALYHQGKNVPLGMRIRIRPGRARLVLGVPVSELVDQFVPLRALWGAPADRLISE